jgi:hypothetical protein
MRAFLLLAATAALPLIAANPQAPGGTPTPAESCPVTFSSADYQAHPEPLPVPDPNATTREKSYGTLEFQYQNAGGKAVRAFHVTAQFAPPAGVRPPLLKSDTAIIEHFIQSDPLAAGDASHASYEIAHDVSRLLWLRLDQVQFQDGSLWQRAKTAPEGQCTFYPKAALVPAGR